MRNEPPITFLNLLRKYRGNIKRAHPLEMKAAARAVPAGKNKMEHLFDSAHNYIEETVQRAAAKGQKLCFNKDGLCEEDHCRCS